MEVKGHPIIFSTPMVQAILQGRKTQTRRILKMPKKIEAPQFGHTCFTPERGISVRGKHENGEYGESFIKCPYGKPGDLLWVRETFMVFHSVTVETNLKSEREEVIDRIPGGIGYKADLDECGQVPVGDVYRTPKDHWRPSIFMPKCHARLWLRITNVRVERLQEIKEQGAIAEGINLIKDDTVDEKLYEDYIDDTVAWAEPIRSFKSLWQKINGDKSWQQNPWVWVIEFEIIKQK